MKDLLFCGKRLTLNSPREPRHKGVRRLPVSRDGLSKGGQQHKMIGPLSAWLSCDEKTKERCVA